MAVRKRSGIYSWEEAAPSVDRRRATLRRQTPRRHASTDEAKP
jgi:hypothetical protein